MFWALEHFMWLVAASVWATAIVSSLLDHGDNPRFLIPLQTPVMFWCLWIAFSTFKTLSAKDNPDQNEPKAVDALEE
jgi:hypothetical protein